MSESELGEEEALGEQSPKNILGEGTKVGLLETIIQEKRLNFEEASKCLSVLGKDESGMRYAYLKMTATERKLTNVQIILNFPHVLFVDISGNYITSEALHVLADMPYVIQIKAQRNFIDSPIINEMTYLQDLSLARNQIATTNGIKQPILEYLDLNYNQIYTVSFISEDLPLLKELELRGNNLFELGGAFPESVEKLYLAENRITRMISTDLARLEHLTHLHLRNNLIRKLDGFTNQVINLKYLNLRQNKIKRMRQFRKLQCLPNLQTLVIMQNPVTGDEEKGDKGEADEPDEEEDWGGEEQEPSDPNRISLLVLLPALIRINKIPVSYEERAEAKEGRDEKYLEIMEEDSTDDEFGLTSEYTTEPNITEPTLEEDTLPQKLADELGFETINPNEVLPEPTPID